MDRGFQALLIHGSSELMMSSSSLLAPSTDHQKFSFLNSVLYHQPSILDFGGENYTPGEDTDSTHDQYCLMSSGVYVVDNFINYNAPPLLLLLLDPNNYMKWLSDSNTMESLIRSLKWRSSTSDHDHQYLKEVGSGGRKQQEIEMYRRRSSSARKRRQKISEKIRCLQKILPWDKKMNIATMLDEAYKYVKFLQAQVLILHSMPSSSSSSSTDDHMFMYGGGGGGGGVISSTGGLENLNRQQVLEVLVNSEVAQTLLYSRGWCVYSLEQVIAFMRQIEQTNNNTRCCSHEDHQPVL